MKANSRRAKREGPQTNRILLPFEKAIEGLLSVKPKKKPAEKKKKPNK